MIIFEGLSLATLSAGALYLVWNALPISVRVFLRKHTLFTRAACLIGTYTIFGGTLTALFAAAWLDLIIGTLLHLSNNPKTAAIMERMASKITELREKLVLAIERGIQKFDNNQTRPQLTVVANDG